MFAPISAPVLALSLGWSLAACSATPPPLRPEPVPYADTLPIRPPPERDLNQVARLLQESVGGEIGHAFSLRRGIGARHEAVNVTRFDDVVPSAWFEHRNGRRRLTPAEVARGPTTTGPDTAGPLTVIAGKAEGISPGFTVRDASGQRFLFKFDPKGNLHLASSADVVSSRLFWSAGYHTPEDFIVVFDSARLVLDPRAEVETELGVRPMEPADIRAVLELTDPLPDGRFLALASKFLPGRPLGPFLFSGVRRDDPNDYYHHEHRRELRGLYVVSAWLNHVDMRYENTLDVFIDPPGYVRHYLIDFAATLGSGTIRPHNPREGLEYNFDLWPTVARMVTLGFYRMGWEERPHARIHPTLGWMAVESYDPARWKPNWPNEAFRRVTPRDGYWGAKLVGSFTDDQLRAVVDAAGLPDPAAADTLADILAYRRDRTVAYWYGRVTPIENAGVPEAAGEPNVLEVQFEDRGLSAAVWQPDSTAYEWRLEDRHGGALDAGREPARRSATQSIRITVPPEAEDGAVAPLRLRVRALRTGAAGRAADIYLGRSRPARRWRVTGLIH